MNIHHIHFFVEDAPRQREWFVRCLGWTAVGHCHLSDRIIEVLQYRDGLFVLTSARTSDSPVATYLQTYAPGVVDVAIAVDDIALFIRQSKAFKQIHETDHDHLPLIVQMAERGGAMSSTNLANEPSIYICAAGWGRLHHTIIERPYRQPSRPFCPKASHDSSHLKSIDHIVLNVAKGELQAAVAFYQDLLGLQKRQQFNIQTEHSGLNSQVLYDPHTQLYFNINEPTSETSQIQTFMDSNRGAGIQHIALHSEPIVPTVTTLRRRGTPLLSVPQIYYRQLEQRIRACCSSSLHWPLHWPLHWQEWQQIIQQQILIDWQPERPEALLLQIFSQPIFQDNHFFFEFIERRQAVKGFGEGNFLALYQAIEAESAGQAGAEPLSSSCHPPSPQGHHHDV